MSSYTKTWFSNILLVLALAIPPLLAGGCERQNDPPVQPMSLAPDVTPVPKADASPQAQEELAAAPKPEPEPASPIDDAKLTAKVKSALLADAAMKALKINVDTSNAEVTLKGALDTHAQVTRAVEVAEAVDGVRGVVNRLTVKGEDKAANSSQG